MGFIKHLSGRSLPRLVIFVIDLIICTLSIGLAYLVRFNFNIPKVEVDTFYFVFPFMLLVRSSSFILSKTYVGIIRYTGTRDTFRILITLSLGSALFALSNLLSYPITGKYIVPFSIIIIEFLFTVFTMVTGRLLVKIIYMEIINPSSEKTGVIIYGAGEAGLTTKRTLDRDKGTKYKVIAFLDDDPKKTGKKLEGISIYHVSELEKILDKKTINHLIIAIQNISIERKQFIAEAGLSHGLRVLSVPPIQSWINGELSFKQIKKVHIEDLLGRESIQLQLDQIKEELFNKTILVTGAAGSIGSEMVRQILPFKPKLLLLLDIAESPLYDLELEIRDNPSTNIQNIEPIIGDIRNKERMRNVFNTFHPDIIFHAAAYKHVPMMELNPSESILNNVLGTKIIADLSMEFNASKFVMISTDKAVNPTNIMGATKRIAEMYTQSMNGFGKTKFITTRFGNVLGSNGSVIPRFKKQIDSGKPLTITHPDITRYFMTISEACQLVLEAGSMGKGGEIFIFDMGSPVKIADLAKKMIQLSGLELGKDIQINYTGLRPGEKLFEELLANEENTLPTHHKKIMIAKVKSYPFDFVSGEIDELVDLFNSQNNEAIVTKMKKIVPEFLSKNSEYERLDKEISN
ncbi:MAG: polysaccharide biosynthesis protein [Bacteroidia bacterium]|jgi:FlaA1/EpsC-like NDP-sugar epimerase|nr:polysaccharide biosynthesis protein [Bacteroidia bacterium]